MFSSIVTLFKTFRDRRKARAKARGYAKYLFAHYWTYSIDRQRFQQLAKVYARDIFPLIKARIETEMGPDAFKKVWIINKLCWFEIWLIWATGEVLPLRTRNYNNSLQLLCTAEFDRLRSKPWTTVIRHVPIGVWQDVYNFYSSVFLHLAMGYNIRRHPDFSHFTKKMAHQFHTYNGHSLIDHPSGVFLFLISLGHDSDTDDWKLQQLLLGLISAPYKREEFNKLRPLAEQLIKIHANANITDLEWDIIRVYVEDVWPSRPKQVLKNGRSKTQFVRAASRYLADKRKRINVASLLKDFGYEANTRWPAQNKTDWNLRTEKGWYQMVEIQTSEALVLEGALMHHCVGDYLEYCIKGSERICSLRFRAHGKTKWKPKVTISVERGEITEARSILNSVPNEHHQRLVDAWAIGEQLSVNWKELCL